MQSLTNTAPKSFVAGDSVSFSVSYSLYPANDGWVLNFVIATATPSQTTATANGANHDVAITAANSALIAPGQYASSLVFTKALERATVDSGFIFVLPNPTAALTPSWAQATLTLCEAAIRKLGTTSNAVTSVNGQTYTKQNIQSLLALRDRLLNEVAAELSRLGRPSRGGRKTIVTRFKS